MSSTVIPIDGSLLLRVTASIEKHHDFPKPGILFQDVFSLWRHPDLVEAVISAMSASIKQRFPSCTVLLGLESRGFLFGSLIAAKLSLPFVPVRKAGKLPGECSQKSYLLEYGTATLELQKRAIKAGDCVVIIDDLLATGGTLAAAVSLAQAAGAHVLGAAVMIELQALHGAVAAGVPVLTLIQS